ncbi:hypothetical protein ACJX0J_027107, partial [Zea mays]
MTSNTTGFLYYLLEIYVECYWLLVIFANQVLTSMSIIAAQKFIGSDARIPLNEEAQIDMALKLAQQLGDGWIVQREFVIVQFCFVIFHCCFKIMTSHMIHKTSIIVDVRYILPKWQENQSSNMLSSSKASAAIDQYTFFRKQAGAGKVASLFVMIVLFFHIFLADWWDQYSGDYPELQDTFALLHKLMISYQIVFTFELIMHYFEINNAEEALHQGPCFKNTRIWRMHGLIQWQDFEHVALFVIFTGAWMLPKNFIYVIFGLFGLLQRDGFASGMQGIFFPDTLCLIWHILLTSSQQDSQVPLASPIHGGWLADGFSPHLLMTVSLAHFLDSEEGYGSPKDPFQTEANGGAFWLHAIYQSLNGIMPRWLRWQARAYPFHTRPRAC